MYLKVFLLVHIFIQNVTYGSKIYNIAGLMENDHLARVFRYTIDEINSESNSYFNLNLLNISVNSDDPFSSLNSICHVLREGVVGVYGLTSPSNVHIVQSVCDAKQIPHIITHWAEPIESGIQINFYPQPKFLTQAYMDIISNFNWNEFTILYLNSESLPRLGNFIESSKTTGHIVYIENLDPDGTENYRPILRELRKSSQTHFILDCDVELLEDALFQIQQVGMLTSDYKYFLTNPDIPTKILKAFANGEADITGIQLVNPLSSDVQNLSALLYNQNYQNEGWEVDSQTALIIDAVHIFSNALKSLEVNQDSNLNCSNSETWKYGLDIVNKVKSSSYSGLTGDVQFNSDGQRNVFELIIYNLNEGGITQAGAWSTLTGLNIMQFTDESTRENDREYTLKNKRLIVMTTLAEPYAMIKQATHALVGNDRYEGYVIDLIHEISKIEEFSYTFIIREDMKYGFYDIVEGSWSGIIGDLINGKADLALADLTITLSRIHAVDFTDPFMHFGISILYKKPLPAAPGFFYFARPFTADLWTAIAYSSVAVTLCLYIIGRLCPSEWQKTNIKSKYVVNQLTFSNTIWFVAGSLFRHTTQVKIRSVPGRIVAAVWWLFCFSLIATYISSLITYTITLEEVVQFTDAKSLVTNARDHGIRYGALRGGSTEEFFRNSNDPLYQEIYQHMLMHPEDMVDTSSEGVHRVETSNYAFFMESTSIEYMTNRYCDLSMYGGLLNEKGYGIAARHGSPYLPALSRAILKLGVSGKLAALKRKWWEKKHGGTTCNHEEPEDIIGPIDLLHISGLVYITSFGVTLAVLSAILEFSIHTYRLSRILKVPLFRTFKHEIKTCFGGNVKRVIDPTLLSRSTPEDTRTETVELS